jgi:hypothetical protein
MAAAKQEALMLGDIRAEGDDERSNGPRVTRVEAIASGSDAGALVYTDARDLVQSGEFALSLPGGGVLTAQSKTLPDERSEIERRWESAFRVWDSRFRGQGSGLRVRSSGFRV